MGALAPVLPWLPEDDLLLKNSIEAGASLESLAKGAVQFSRKFTVRELQDRWRCLLYDPVISEEASLRMIEYERSTPNFPAKLGKAGSLKESRNLNGKRKSESVRSCYYSLRKRILSEPLNSMDLSFFVAPNNENFFGNGDEPLSDNCMLGDPVANNFGFQDSNLDIIPHPYHHIPADGNAANGDGCIAQQFHNGYHHPVDEALPMQQNDITEGIPLIFGESQSFIVDDYGIEEMGRVKEQPNMFEANHLEANFPSTFDQVNGDPQNIGSEFEENQVFNSQISESDPSFQNIYSPLPEMPIWRTVEDISSPAMSIDDSLREKDFHTGNNTCDLPDDGDPKDTSVPGHDVVDEISDWNIPMSCDRLKDPLASTGNYLEELSNSLLNLNDDELLMDDDGKEIIDKSYYDGLSSLLLSSPNDANQDHMPISELQASVPPDLPTTVSDTCLVESVDKVQRVSFVSASTTQLPGVDCGTICCVLNTEDPDVPCNDDVFLPNRFQPSSFSIAPRRNIKEAGNPFSGSTKYSAGNQKFNGGGPLPMQRDQEKHAQPHGSSYKVGSQWRQGNSQLHLFTDGGAKYESPNCDASRVASRTLGIAGGSSFQINLTNIGSDTVHPMKVKEENKDIAVVRDVGRTLAESHTGKPALGSDCLKSNENNGGGSKQESGLIQDQQLSNAEARSDDIPDSNPNVNSLSSEPEEPHNESDDDGVPYFSDIEAMILDMDLDPDDNDLYEQEVSRYLHESTRKTIMRLEQCARSCIKRDIAFHGAFAVFRGHHSKHFIKKPEVLLGRTTEDVVVDIDLGREGRANKISRRQAIINMDKDGCFHLKNLGKNNILINNKEVAPGQITSLTSCCLVEIKRIPFVFETNEKCVKQYLDSTVKENQSSEHQV